MKNYRTLTLVLIGTWFAFALAASARHLFRNDADRIGAAVGLAALVPVLAFALWFMGSKPFREFILGLNPRTLTAVHAWRIMGFVFVLLQARGALPGVFAFPAGFGDMAIGATAAFVAWKLVSPAHRRIFILWHALGIADLVTAVGLGTTARLFASDGVSMATMTVLPMSLVPTFIVPLLLVLHLISIAQAARLRTAFAAAPDYDFRDAA